MPNLNHKVALITGGASGLGKAIATRLASDGARVVITDIQDSLGEAAAAEHGFTFLKQDVTHETRWGEVICEIQQRHGGLHVLVNNAGLLSPRNHATPEGIQMAEWRQIFAVNLEGVFMGCRAAIPLMHASGGGSIINISSIAGILAVPYAMAYGVSKAAVRHLTKCMAQYCAERQSNIRCNSVHPGIVRTPPWEKAAAEKARERGVSVDALVAHTQSLVPMGTVTEASDIAGTVAFLACDDSRHMTGQQLVIDGGVVHCDTYHIDLIGRRVG